MPAVPENGVVRIASQQSVAETVAKLETMLQAKNVKLFAIVDHSGEAEKAGLRMRRNSETPTTKQSGKATFKTKIGCLCGHGAQQCCAATT
jgi:hypothetical protein